MIPTPTKLLAEIDSGAIPLSNMFSTADCNSLLHKRGSDSSFDKAYREVSDLIEKLKFILNRDPVESVRKYSYLIVSNATDQHEIASHVANDFEIIAWQASSLADQATPRLESEFIDWLYLQYKASNFPCPPYFNSNSDRNGE